MASTPPSPISSSSIGATAAPAGVHAVPAHVIAPLPAWPGSTKSFIVRDAVRGDLRLKLAQEHEALQIWLEEASTKRQFYASHSDEECRAIVKDLLDPQSLSEMLSEALSAKGEAGEELRAAFEWSEDSVTLALHWKNKWVTKAFFFPLPEREVSQMDRIERRLDDVEAKLLEKAPGDGTVSCVNGPMPELRAGMKAELKAELMAELKAELKAEQMAKVRLKKLSSWTLKYEGIRAEDEHVALIGDYFLTQDTDFTMKHSGVRKDGPSGFIQATFQEPVHVSSVTVAPFPMSGWHVIANKGTLAVQVQSPETGAFEDLQESIPQADQNKEIQLNVGKVIMALRLTGEKVGISKLIFS